MKGRKSQSWGHHVTTMGNFRTYRRGTEKRYSAIVACQFGRTTGHRTAQELRHHERGALLQWVVVGRRGSIAKPAKPEPGIDDNEARQEYIKMPLRQRERHRGGQVGWLRAAVLGANDGLLSTASLVLGVAAAHEPPGGVLIAGIAGLVAGAMSMAAGEYVSVHSQADTEQADLVLERAELRADDKGEHQELAAIYVERGLDASLARQVADQLMAHDAIGAHARDELGMSETLRARPVQAAFASAGSFAVGAAMPLVVTVLAPGPNLIFVVSGTSLLFLASLGALAARAGGASVTIGAVRVTCWGALAMAVTAGIGALVGKVI